MGALLESFCAGEDPRATPVPAAEPERPKGPWCQVCGHEYRTKKGEIELAALFPLATCPYCLIESKPVEIKPFEEISKSKFECFRCRRRGAFKYVEHRPDAKHPSAEFGIAGHELAEDWLAKRRLPVINSLAAKSIESRAAVSLHAGIPHAPQPDHPGLKVESEFHFEFGGVRWMGWKDFEAPAAGALVPGASNLPFVGDWKFTADLKWALTPENLATDVQGVLESYDWTRRDPNIAGVWLKWIYMERGKRVARATTVFVTAQHVAAEMAKLLPSAYEILEIIRTKPPANSLPPNLSQCKLYPPLGCPFTDVCDLTPSQRMQAQIEGEDPIMNNVPTAAPGAPSALDNLMSQFGQASAPPQGIVPPPAVTAPTPAPVAYVPPPQGIVPPPAVTAPPVAPAPIAVPPDPSTHLLVSIVGVAEPVSVPVSQLSQLAPGSWAPYTGAPAVAATPAAPPAKPRGRPKKETPAPVAAAPATAPIAPPVAWVPPVPVQTAAAAQTLPPATFAVQPPAAPAPVVAPIAAPAPATTGSNVAAFQDATDNASVGPAFTLFVNCTPTKHPAGTIVMRGSELVALIHEAVCKDNTPPVRHYKEIAYGAGPGILAVYLDKYITHAVSEGDFGEDCAITIDTRTTEGADIAPTLERLARFVVRGC